MSKLNIFVPITKVDAVKGIVYGTLAAEELDRSGEIFDYAGSKPYFEKWSEAASKATGGKSLGNLRAMHGSVAAGKFTDMAFDDDGKKITVAAKIVDKNELEKALEGVYTGFSIGGKYVSRKKDGDVFRYVADPYEGSLVDLPCIASATFEIVKADGMVTKKFNPGGEVEAKARELAKAAKVDPEAEIKVSDKIVRNAWTNYEAEAIDELTKAADADNVAEPTNDEIAAEARELAKAAGDESKWIDQLEPARDAIKAKRKAKSKAGEKPAAGAAGATGNDEGENDADDDEGAAPAGKSATVGDDEPWVQKWTHPELPGQSFDKKADLRVALVTKRAVGVAKPVTDALDALKTSLVIRETTVKAAIAATWEKQEKAIQKACGISDEDHAQLAKFIAANPAHAAVKALAAGEVRVKKEGGDLIEVTDATKALVADALGAAKDELEKNAISDSDRAKLVKTGAAMPDGSLAITDRSTLKAAVDKLGRAKAPVAAKRHIIKRAVDLDIISSLPADWGIKPAVVFDLTKFAGADKAADLKKAASLYGVAELVRLLASVDSAEECLEAPGYGYGTIVPKDLCDRFGKVLVEMGDIVVAVLDLVLQETRDEEAAEAADVMRAAGLMSDLAKLVAERPLEKIGARHAKIDQKRINEAHDLLVDAGAQCEANDDTEKLAGDGDIRKLLDTERATFAKTMGDITDVLKEVADRVKRIEEQPMPEGTSHVNVAEKNGEGFQANKFINPNARAFAELTGEMVGMAIKAAQQEPHRGAPGNTYFDQRRFPSPG